MSLDEAARAAGAEADTSIDPIDHRLALALEGALAAEQQPERPPSDLTGIPPASGVTRSACPSCGALCDGPGSCASCAATE
jgi:hypothetical protein